MRALLITLLLVATAAPATAGENEVTFGPTTRALRSASANALTENSLDGGGLSYGRHLPLELFPKLAVWATAGLSWGSASGTMFRTMTTELDTMTYTLGGRARYTLHRRAIATARFDLGTARTAVSLRDMADHSASDAAWGGISSGALGLDLLAIAHRRFTLGLRFELGYVTATAVELTARSDRGDEDTLELPNMESSLGSLDLGGRFFAFSVISQF